MRLFLTLLVLLLCALQYRLWFGEANVRQISELQAQIAEQKKENDRLQLRNKQLEAEVNDLKKGTSAIEERARSGQGMVKEGETFYQLVNPHQRESEQADVPAD